MKLGKSNRYSLNIFLLSLLLAIVWTGQALATEADSHEKAYEEALARLQAAPQRLLSEMEKVRSGEVAHFDYLQYAHIELLRDSRAVRFPPASLDQYQREEVRDQAEQILQTATELELTIADFLRAQALINGALSSTIDIAKAAGQDVEPGVQLVLTRLDEAATAYRNEVDRDRYIALNRAFDAVAEVPLHGRYKKELAIQKEFLANNEQAVETAMQRVGAAGLEMAIAQLIQLYDEASPLLSSR